jgi:hypothetical protein
MPCALRDLQAAFAAHLAGTEQADLAREVIGDTIAAAARLRVYRHHVLSSLSSALAATFPTVNALVGEKFFAGLARAFLGTALPSQPVLAEYGADFPAFVAGYAPAAALPYLADVARLDWALNAAFHASPQDGLTAADLAEVPAERLPSSRLRLSAGTALIVSAYPLDRIWAASQPDAPATTVDLNGEARLLVLRQADDAAFVSLSVGEAAFAGALAEGATLEEAAGAAGAVDPVFDLAAAFARLLGLGSFAALQ